MAVSWVFCTFSHSSIFDTPIPNFSSALENLLFSWSHLNQFTFGWNAPNGSKLGYQTTAEPVFRRCEKVISVWSGMWREIYLKLTFHTTKHVTFQYKQAPRKKPPKSVTCFPSVCSRLSSFCVWMLPLETSVNSISPFELMQSVFLTSSPRTRGPD